MRVQRLAFALYLALGTGAAGAEKQSPAEMARLLQDVQTQVANGAKGGQEALRALLSAMNDQFEAMDESQWREPRNARALALYVMSGGRSEVAQRVLAAGLVPQSEQALLRGATAQAEMRAEEARKQFEGLDPRTFDPALGAHVAFAKANVATDRAQARALLELARLLAPGGLIDEAALRRSVFLAGEAGDVEAFVDLSQRYARRFRGSAYFGNFARGFVNSAQQIPLSRLESRLDSVAVVTAALPVESRNALRLDLARRALLEGRNEISERMSHAALGGLGAADRRERMRAALYAAATMVGGARHNEARDALARIAEDELSVADRNLLTVARAGARHIAPKSAGGRIASRSPSLVETTSHARRLLDETVGLLGEGSR